MSLIFTLISTSAYIQPPQDLLGWLGFVVLFAALIFALWRWRAYNRPWGNFQAILLAVLFLAALVTSLFIGIRLPSGAALPPPELPIEPPNPAVMIFSAIPWVLAAGILGPTSAAVIAMVAGLAFALWETHNPFTILELAFLAFLFSLLVRQRYRTTIFNWLRHPLVAALALAVLFPFIHMGLTIVMSRGLLVTRLDYALTNLQYATIALAIELFVAGSFAEAIAFLLPAYWGGNTPLTPSPAEQSLQIRFIVSMAPLAVLLILTIMVGDWYIAGRAARGMLEARMANAAEMVAENVPYFLEMGQNLISSLAKDPDLLTNDANELRKILDEGIKSVPFFSQLSVVDRSGKAIASYPNSYFVANQAPME